MVVRIPGPEALQDASYVGAVPRPGQIDAGPISSLASAWGMLGKAVAEIGENWQESNDAKAQSDLKVAWIKAEDQIKQDAIAAAGPSGEGYAEAYSGGMQSWWAKEGNGYLGRMSPKLRTRVEGSYAVDAAEKGVGAMKAERTQRSSYLVNETQRNNETLANRIYQNPEEHDTLLSESLANIDRQQQARAIDPLMADQMRRETQEAFTRAKVGAALEGDPNNFYKWFRSTAPTTVIDLKQGTPGSRRKSGLGGADSLSPGRISGATDITTSRSGNASHALNYLMRRGLSSHQAAGVVGNLMQESGTGLNPNARNPGDGRDGTDSIGIGQWNSGRARALQAFARERGTGWNNLETQLDFILHELKTSERGAGDQLSRSRNVEEAVGAMLGYERPKNFQARGPGSEHDRRSKYARQIVGSAGAASEELQRNARGTNVRVASVATGTTSDVPINDDTEIDYAGDPELARSRTATVEKDGKFYNVPLVIEGRAVSPEEAKRLFGEGKNNPVGEFGSEQEARTASEKGFGDIMRTRAEQADANPYVFKGPTGKEVKVSREDLMALKPSELRSIRTQAQSGLKMSVNQEFDNYKKSLQDGGLPQGLPELYDKIRTVEKPVAAEAKIAELQRLEAQAIATKRLTMVPITDHAALLRQLEPDPNDPTNYEARKASFDAFEKAASQIQKDIKSDPALFMFKNSEGSRFARQIFQNSGSTDAAFALPEETPLSAEFAGPPSGRSPLQVRESALQLMLDNQSRMGIAPADQKLLTKDERARVARQFQDAMNSNTPEMTRQLVIDGQKLYGKYFGRVMAEAAGEGVPKQLFVLDTMTDTRAVNNLLESMWMQAPREGKKENLPIETKEAKKGDQAVSDALAKFKNSLPIPYGGGQAAWDTNNFTINAYESAAKVLTYRYMAAGDSPGGAATRAFKEILGSYNFLDAGKGNTLMVPSDQIGSDQDRFMIQSSVTRLDQSLKARMGDIVVNQRTLPGITPSVQDDRWRTLLLSGATAKTSPDFNGVTVYDHNELPVIVRNRDGSMGPLRITWDELKRQPLPQAIEQTMRRDVTPQMIEDVLGPRR